MSELITDVKSLELETLKNLKSSKASNTLRAYKADYKDFALFCIKHGFKSMPTDPKVLSLYLTHLSQKSKFIPLLYLLVVFFLIPFLIILSGR